MSQPVDRGRAGRSGVDRCGLREIHRRFCGKLPESRLTIGDTATGGGIRGVPGSWRVTDVVVGRHHDVSPGAVERLMG
ncbi:MAG: hypothetical protein EXS06_13085 [Planctomycetaceae bacterium]|nr:hypothetical protein [Planctomycetaceae bacterium]